MNDTAIGNPSLVDQDVEIILDLLVWFYCHAKFNIVMRDKSQFN